MNIPVAFFAYNRPFHTYQTLKYLSLNKEAISTDIYAFIDGKKKNSEIHLIDNVEKIINSFLPNFRDIKIYKSDENLSCGINIKNGVTKVLSKNKSVIVLEDDIIVSEFFLSYMNKALNLYKNERKIWHINGFNYPIKSNCEFDCFFSRLMQCWGWATWSDRWNEFIDDPLANDPYFLMDIFSKSMIKRLNLDLKENLFWSQVQENANGKLNNTWAIFWYCFIFRKMGLCLTPKISLTRNIGHDGSGIHSTFDKELLSSQIKDNEMIYFPSSQEEDSYSLNLIKKYFKKKNNFFSKIKRKLHLFF